MSGGSKNNGLLVRKNEPKISWWSVKLQVRGLLTQYLVLEVSASVDDSSNGHASLAGKLRLASDGTTRLHSPHDIWWFEIILHRGHGAKQHTLFMTNYE